MKKIISLILTALMVLSVVASCGKKPSSKPSTPSSSSTITDSSSTSSNKPSSSSSSSASSKVDGSSTTSSSKEDSKPSSSATGSSTTSSESSESSSESDTSGIVDTGGQEQTMVEGSKTTASGFGYEDYEEIGAGKVYNRNLFYYNELSFEVADPSVIWVGKDQSAEFGGYFYAYGTSDQLGCNGLQAWRSKDMTNWEDLGPVYRPDHMNNWARTNFWAPEIIYDAAGQTINGTNYHYFMFYNADLYTTVVNNTAGVGGLLSATTNPTFEGNSIRYLGVLYSNSPAGPFVAPENVTNLDGKTLNHNNPPFDFCESAGIPHNYACRQTIDASPFIDTDGTRYLYYSGYRAPGNSAQCIYGVRMKDWLTPDYSTVTMICEYGKTTPGGSSISEGDYVTEGPFMYKKDGTYFMTFSTFNYMNENYQVRLARSNNPLSGFVKVDPNNGGTVIKTETTWTMKSVGHHAFITVGDQLFIAYHTFKDGVSIANGRALAIDECKVIDYNGGKIIVANGPTKSYQPLPYAVSGYKNIANQATVNVEATTLGADKSVLTDGLIKFHANNGYTADYLSGGNVKVTMEFSSYKSVRALMVYLPFEASYRFQGLKNVVITYNGGTINIDKVALDLDAHMNTLTSRLNVPGGAAILEFDDLPVKKIEFMLDNYVRNGSPLKNAGMSEIVVLSNPNGSTAKVTNVNKKYSYLNAAIPAAIKHDQGKVLGSVNVDGTVYHTTFGFENIIEEDDGSVGSIVKNSWTRDQYAFFKGVNSDTVYFEGKINVYEGAYLNDYYPKLGLVLKNYSACTFFYIDAAGNYSNKVVGYTQSKIGGGDWDWTGTEKLSSAYTAGKISYKGGENWVKLAIARVGDSVKMYCEDVLIFSATGLRGLGNGTQAACGFLCFNTGMRIKDYSVTTGTAAVEAKIADLQATTDAYISTQTGGISNQFGDINGNRKSATTWDTSKDYSTVHPSYDSRQLVLSSTDGIGNKLYYKEATDTLYYMEAKFTAGSVYNNEKYGKFGYWITDYYGVNEAGANGADKNGVFFYVDAQGSGTNITGTNVALAKIENGTGNITYGVKTANGKYTPGQPITLGVFRQGLRFVFFVNGVEVFNYDSGITGKANPAFASYNIGLTVTNYKFTTSKTDAIISQYYIPETDKTGLTTVTFGDADATKTGWMAVGFTEKTTGGAKNTTAGEAVSFANVAGTMLYFEAEISLPGNIYNADGYPKAGLYIKSNSCDLMFAIDALPNGIPAAPFFGGNNYVAYGYRPTNEGVKTAEFTWCDNASIGNAMFRGVKGMTYNSNGSAKMQILYLNGDLYLGVNDMVIYKLPANSIPGLNGGINVGVMCFNLEMVVAAAKVTTDATVIETIKKNLGFSDETLGVTIDGDLSDWTKNNTKYSYWDNSATPLGFEVMAAMGDKGVYVGIHGVVSNYNAIQNDWWRNTNVEMKVYNSSNGEKQQVYLNVKNQAMWVGAYAITYKKSGNVNDVYFEFMIPYTQIGYTGTEDYVAIFFALRPGTPSTDIDDTNSNGEAWWTGSVHQDNQSFNSATYSYKVTKNGIVIA